MAAVVVRTKEPFRSSRSYGARIDLRCVDCYHVSGTMSKEIKMKPPFSGKSAVVHVLGCKVNQAEGAALGHLLESRGYTIDAESENPDLVLVNTCCVTMRAEGKSRRAVAGLAERFPNARLVVTGCLAEVNPTALQSLPGNSIILGTRDKDRFEEFLDDPEEDRHPLCPTASTCTTFTDLGAPGIPGRARAFLKVQDGCSQRCSYCIVPTARGPSRSLPVERSVFHARTMALAGHAEIVLTGIHLGWYGRDLNPRTSLTDLLEQLLEHCPDSRFRLSSIEAQEVTDRLIELAATNGRVCRHFHIPLQSGDDAILRSMRRPYDAALVIDLLGRIFRIVPDACVGFDVMVGFPGEDEASFQRTLELVAESGAAYLHVFPFSPRPGTPAASFEPKVADPVARERVKILRRLSGELKDRFYRRFLGRTLQVVAESEPDPETGSVTARTDNYIPVEVREVPGKSLCGTFSATLVGINDGHVQGVFKTQERDLPNPR
jgi:threonylcarbamoyladenosine tRNA methylthiotransferase MtaB